MSGLYFDTAYVGKCYVQELDAPAVRETARSAQQLYTSSLTIAELSCALHRNLRDGTITPTAERIARDQFLEDIRNEIWTLLPVTERVLRKVESLTRTLPKTMFLRAGDAIHIVSAMDAGFDEIWTNDRHLLAAAAHFRLKGRSVRVPAK